MAKYHDCKTSKCQNIADLNNIIGDGMSILCKINSRPTELYAGYGNITISVCRVGHRRKRARQGRSTNEGIASLTAPPVSTVAEEVVMLLRKLHSLPDWNSSINGLVMWNGRV